MAVTFVTSQDAGVPTLTNAAGSMVALMDYLLGTRLGWVKAFSALNRIAYKQPPGTNEMYVYIEDLTAGVYSAKIRGYETMSSIDEGTNPFPNTAQVAIPSMLKSASASSPCHWAFLSNGKIWYLVVHYSWYFNSTTPASNGSLFAFGDIAPAVAGDKFATMVMGSVNTGATDTGTGGVSLSTPNWWLPSISYTNNNYIARSYTQVGISRPVQKFTDTHVGGASTNMCSGGIPRFPDTATNAFALSRVHVAEFGCYRGYLPGIWSHNHNLSTDNPAISTTSVPVTNFSGAGPLGGREFQYRYLSSCGVIFETSDTWD